MGIRKRGDKWLVTAESGRDEFGARRVCRSVDTEDEAKRLDAKLQHEVYEGRHVKPSSETVAPSASASSTAETRSRRQRARATRPISST